jgi:hypothetical protein
MEKIVYLKRATPFVHEAMNSEAMQEQLALSQRSIGSYLTSKTNKRPATGLTPAEESILLPILLEVSETNAIEYNKAKFDYFNDIVTKIPGGKVGLPLNIGLRDNTKPVCSKIKVKQVTSEGTEVEIDVINLPDNIEQYIRYRHAINFPDTAKSTEEAIGNSLIQYYIEDPTRVIQNNFKELEIKDNAWTEYVKAKSDPDRVNMLLTVLKTYIRKQPGKPPLNINNLGLEERIIALRDLATNRPEKFYQFAIDKDLKKRYLIEECLAVNILTRIGNTFVDIEDNNSALGDTINDVVMNLWNPKETSRLNRLKAKYDEKKGKSKVLA